MHETIVGPKNCYGCHYTFIYMYVMSEMRLNKNQVHKRAYNTFEDNAFVLSAIDLT